MSRMEFLEMGKDGFQIIPERYRVICRADAAGRAPGPDSKYFFPDNDGEWVGPYDSYADMAAAYVARRESRVGNGW